MHQMIIGTHPSPRDCGEHLGDTPKTSCCSQVSEEMNQLIEVAEAKIHAQRRCTFSKIERESTSMLGKYGHELMERPVGHGEETGYHSKQIISHPCNNRVSGMADGQTLIINPYIPQHLRTSPYAPQNFRTKWGFLEMFRGSFVIYIGRDESANKEKRPSPVQAHSGAARCSGGALGASRTLLTSDRPALNLAVV
ncbi:hypothetical protein VNO77_03760 [Canavalia gladiata]|uniref:Uncharacterized protein n=1 Tax=Canavalia gladiata TaxID=3824 RepID=A0AAN9R754_CANGL